MAAKKDVCIEMGEAEVAEVEIQMEETVTIKTKVAPDGGFGWAVTFSTCAITFLLTGFLKSFGAFRPAIIKEFPASDPSDASWIPALIGTLSLVLSPVTGVLMTSVGYKAMIICGGALCSSGLALSYFSTSIGFLVFSLGVLMGIGASFTISSAVICVGKYFTTKKPMAISIALSGGCFGAMVMPDYVRAIVAAVGLRYAFLIFACLLGLICLLGFMFGPPEAHFHSIDKEVPIGQGTVEGVQAESEGAVVKFFKQLGRSFALQYFGEPRFLLTLSAAFVIGLGGHFMPFIPQQARLVGVEATSTARLSFYVAIGDLSARIIYGILASRSPFPRTVEFTAAVSICAIVAVVIPFAPAMGYLIALSLIGGLGSGVVVISLPLVLSSNHGADMMSGTFNLVRLFQGVAKIIYPAIAGALRTNHGATAMMYFAASLMCTGAVLGFVLHFVCLLVNKRKREAEGTTV